MVAWGSICVLSNAEAVRAGGNILGHVDRVDASRRRTVPDGALEPVDGLPVAFDGHLDPAIGEIPHPPVDTLARGHVRGKVPKPDRLNATADQIPSCDAHLGRIESSVAISVPARPATSPAWPAPPSSARL